MTLSRDTGSQIEAFKQDQGNRGNDHRPLIICDADEVLLRFVQTFERYLDERGLYLRLDSFALSGNIRLKKTDDVVAVDDVKDIMRSFFANRVKECPPVENAPQSLEQLSKYADIVILTNLSASLRADREEAMAEHGMPYPVISNEGLKGAAVKKLAAGNKQPIIFLDDLPPNITSVAEHTPHVHRIHFIADERLRPLLGPAKDAHKRIDCWLEAHDYLDAFLNEKLR